MKKTTSEIKRLTDTDMRNEYDFSEGVRGKHHNAFQAGYTVTVHKEDGTTVFKEVAPREGAVILEPEIRAYFPDSESVNRALRCLIPLLPKKRRGPVKIRKG
jgi:hypothetical protein